MCNWILPSETEIVGGWVSDDGQVKADRAALRIDELVSQHLIELAVSDEGWSVLYTDPDDGRNWELTYPDNPSHGGGVPGLAIISSDAARAHYKT